jgi:mycothiol synthase
MSGTIRLFRWDDLPSIVDVMNRWLQALGSENRVTQAEVESNWRAPHNHPEQTCYVMEQADGSLSAFTIADLLDDPAQANGVYFVPPGQPEAADQLIKAAEEHFWRTAQAAGVNGATMTYDLSDKATEGIAALETCGYKQVRQFHVMQAVLDTLIALDPVPDGLTLRPFEAAHDAQATYEAKSEAFQDHWGFYMLPFDEWMHDARQPDFDPSHWWLAFESDQIAGLVLSRPTSERTAWVSIVGVRPAWRRRGIARLLLQRCFAIHQRQGRQRIYLGVDVDNRYQATALYERAGMTIHSRTLYYQKHFGTP